MKFNDSNSFFAEFDKEKNGCSIEEISSQKEKVWWICELGHSYEMSLKNRQQYLIKNRCPYCRNKKVLTGYNDLAFKCPELLNEWDYSKNTINPNEVRFNSDTEVFWKCEKGHSWTNQVSYRSKGYGKCVQCVNLTENFPELIDEWDFEKNTIDPKFIRYGSVEKAWWIGKECGHKWEQGIRSRTRDKHGCPYCSGQKILKGFNDLGTTNPIIAQQWSAKNSKTVDEVGQNNKNKFIWTDICGHEWEMSIYHRKLLKNLSCPVCKSILFTHPKIAEQLHPTKNKNINTKLLPAGSEKKVWWKHPVCGHEWEQTIYGRTKTINESKCQICINKHVIKGINDLGTTNKGLIQEWNFDKNDIDPYEISKGSNRKAWWICAKNKEHEWEAIVSDRNRGSGCPDCYSSQTTSQPERDIQEFIKNHGIEIIANSRKILKSGKELDIYLPKYKIGIEFNGLYWHNEDIVGKNYHYEKWKESKETGIQLISIWEDDWLYKKELIQQMLLHKIKVSKNKKIYARKTYIREVSTKESNHFLNNNHIQGEALGSIKLGLIFHDKIVAISVFKKNNRTAELVRYATSDHVVGGFTKLLKYFENNYDFDQITTFSDHSVSDGNLYINNGFIEYGEIKPDYSYIIGRKRTHKFNYRLKKFKNDPNLIWEDGLTEKELAKLNNLKRIWDCGKTKFVKILDNKTQAQ